MNGKIFGILDNGPTRVGVESTVLDLSTPQPAILRPGAVTKAQIESVIGSIDLDQHHVGTNETPKAPGMKYRHYAPGVPVAIVDPQTNWQSVNAWIAKQPYKVGVLKNRSWMHSAGRIMLSSTRLAKTSAMPAHICLPACDSLTIKKTLPPFWYRGWMQPVWAQPT